MGIVIRIAMQPWSSTCGSAAPIAQVTRAHFCPRHFMRIVHATSAQYAPCAVLCTRCLRLYHAWHVVSASCVALLPLSFRPTRECCVHSLNRYCFLYRTRKACRACCAYHACVVRTRAGRPCPRHFMPSHARDMSCCCKPVPCHAVACRCQAMPVAPYACSTS